MKQNQSNLEDLIKSGLNRRAQGLDPASLASLQAGRREALVALRRPWWHSRVGLPGWLPLSLAMATVLLVAVMLLPLQGNSPAVVPELPGDASILAYDEGLDLVEEAAFYTWLDAESG